MRDTKSERFLVVRDEEMRSIYILVEHSDLLHCSHLHLVFAAAHGVSERSFSATPTERASALAKPFFRLADCFNRMSSISTVAILATVTAQPITSAGRRSPLGPFAMLSLAWRLSACPLLFVTHHDRSSFVQHVCLKPTCWRCLTRITLEVRSAHSKPYGTGLRIKYSHTTRPYQMSVAHLSAMNPRSAPAIAK